MTRRRDANVPSFYRRYLLLLIGLAALTVGGYFVFVGIVDRSVDDAHLINVYGMQRMRSQKLAKQALTLQTFEDPAHWSVVTGEMRDTLRSFRETHRLLSDTSTEWMSSSGIQRDLIAALADLDEHFGALAASADAILAIPPPDRSAAAIQPHVLAIVEHESSFLAGMHRVVELIEQDAQSFMNFAKWSGLSIMVLSLFVIGLSLSPARAAAREIEQRRVAERALQSRIVQSRLLHETSTVTTEVDSQDDAFRRCITLVCMTLRWPVGHIYLRSESDRSLLEPSSIWYIDDAEQFSRFREVTERTTFRIGIGLPGRILASGKPAWIVDVQEDPNFPRAKLAHGIGVHGAFGFPIKVGREVVAVAEFFASEPLEPDDDLLRLAGSIGEQLGRIIERRTATREIEQQEIRLRAMFETVVDALITIDERGTIESFNDAAQKMFGYDASEVIGKNVRMLMPEPYRGEHDGYLKKYRETGQGQVIGVGREAVAVRKNGETFPIELSVGEMRLEASRMFVGVVRDITERHRVDRLKNEFVSVVSHELRTPLTSIHGSLGLISSGVTGELSEQAQGMVDIAERNCDRLIRLINDILDVEKIEAGKLEFEMGRVDLMALVGQAIESNRAYAERFGVTLELARGPGEAWVEADADRIVQVLTNLLSNAAKFSPEGGSVEVAVDREAAGLRVSVIDHGQGIPEEFQPRIFEKFSQAADATTRKRGGTGLGLSICKLIVERHEGRIGFDTAPGVGTTFFFVLPEPKAAAPPVRAARPAPAGRRILVCEDDRDVATVLSHMIEAAGFSADVAASAEEARGLLEERTYAAMTLDIGLPGTDGITFVREPREHDELRSLPIVIVSAHADRGRSQLGEEVATGAVSIVDILDKPLDSARLLESLRSATQRGSPGKPTILHVEDDDSLRQVVAGIVGEHATLLGAGSLAAARRILDREAVDLVLLDIGLPDGSGAELLGELGPERDRAIPVVVFSGEDLDTRTARMVAAVLGKSRTSNDKLLQTILGQLELGVSA